MDNREIREIELNLRKLKELQFTIKKLERFLANLQTGSVVRIVGEYRAPSQELFGQIDAKGEGDYLYSTDLDYKYLGISEEEFKMWFDMRIKDYIAYVKSEIERKLLDL